MSARHDGSHPPQEPDRIAGGGAVAWWLGTVLGIAAVTGISFIVLRIALPDPGAHTIPSMDAGGSAPYAVDLHRTAPDSLARSRLGSYRWIDREEGRLAVPIEEAMRLLAASEGDR